MTENKNYNLIFKMIKANRIHKMAIDNAADSLGIHRSQHQMLMKLAKSDSIKSQKQIADELGVTQAAVTVTLSKLEKEGLIERRVGKDTRFNEISITDKGREIVEKSRELFVKVDKEAFRNITDEQLSVFESCLDVIYNNLDGLLLKEDKQ